MLTTAPSNVPGIGSLLISTGVIGDECSLCGNSFENYQPTISALRLPCVDSHCETCARMWRILNSPTCLVCYGDFKCPRFTRKEARKALPRLITDTRDTIQQPLPLEEHVNPSVGFRDRHAGFHSVNAAQKSLPRHVVDSRDRLQQASPLDSHIDSFLSFRDRHAAFHNADAAVEDDTNSNPGSPMREEDDDVQAVPKLSEDLLEALTMANDRIGTNFNFQDIKTEIPESLLRNCTRLQLADRLTQACIMKVSQSDCDNMSRRRNSLESKNGNGNLGHCTIDKATSHRCTHCGKGFRSAGHLKQHEVVHTPANRTCSVCGLVLGTANSRRLHERRHQETEGEREERLGKLKAERKAERQKLREFFDAVAGASKKL